MIIKLKNREESYVKYGRIPLGFLLYGSIAFKCSTNKS